MRARPLVLLAAGGTGGHLFPAEALAGELIGLGFEVVLVTDRRGRSFADRLPVTTYFVAAGGLAGGSLWRRALGALRLALGLVQARRLIARLRPDAAVGFGGYASVPTMAAAVLAGLPTLVHEQNAVLGRANRLLARRVGCVAISFEPAALRGLPANAPAIVTGNPVRPAIGAIALQAYQPPRGQAFELLVLSGSLGARVFSRVVPEAVGLLDDEPRRRLAIAQQCRAEDLEAVRAAYGRLGVAAELSSFFDDVPRRLAAAHLVIARAGASTVAELAAAGRPAILVPYPHAADDHQSANARAMAAGGGAWRVPEPEFTGTGLAARLGDLIAAPGLLAEAAAAARAFGRPDAAKRLAQAVLELLRPERREAVA